MSRSTIVLTLFCCPLLVAAPATSQWISFSEEVSSRLSLQPFADNPAGDPMNDGEEKDFAVGDLDQDGDVDVVVVRKQEFSVPGARQDVLLMNESGVLVDRTADLAPGFITEMTDARDVFIGDFSGDGWPDVVIANTFGQQPSFYLNAGDSGGDWLGLVDESSLRFPIIDVPGDVPALQFCALWGGDVTGNGALDIYFSNYRESGGTEDVLFINDGSGFFTNESDSRLGSFASVAFGTSVEIHDMDDDGDNDIIKISTLYDTSVFDIGQYILFNDGTGVFDNIPFQELDSNSPYMFTVGDLNDDSMLDMLMQGDNQDRVAIATSIVPDSNINYAVTSLSSSRTDGFGGNTKLADMDGDGDLDAGIGPIDVDIANCGFADDFALLRNPGNGILEDPWASNDDQNFHVDPHDFAFLDVNSDSCTDMVMGLCTGWRVFIQEECDPGIPCADVGNFLGRCRANVQGNKLQARVVFGDTSHDGETVEISVDSGPAETVTITGRRANFALNGAATGLHTIDLVSPAGCAPQLVVECP